MGFAGPLGLDYAAVFRTADAMGVPDMILAEVLPDIERSLMAALRKAGGDEEEQNADG